MFANKMAGDKMIYVVSGYMRSGTSWLMHLLATAGMPVVRSDVRDQSMMEAFGKINPHGLYEPNDEDTDSSGWPKQHDGQAVKVMAPIIQKLSPHDYSVAFMRRQTEDIARSFETAFGCEVSLDQIEESVADALEHLRSRRDVREVVEIDFVTLKNDGAGAMQRLSSIGWPIIAG